MGKGTTELCSSQRKHDADKQDCYPHANLTAGNSKQGTKRKESEIRRIVSAAKRREPAGKFLQTTQVSSARSGQGDVRGIRAGLGEELGGLGWAAEREAVSCEAGAPEIHTQGQWKAAALGNTGVGRQVAASGSGAGADGHLRTGLSGMQLGVSTETRAARSELHVVGPAAQGKNWMGGGSGHPSFL